MISINGTTLDFVGLLNRLDALMSSNGVRTDAQWSAAMDTIWATGTAGATSLTQQQRQFIAAFFKSLVLVEGNRT